MALNWSLKSRKCHCCLPNCDQGKKIKGKIFYCKKYYIWDYTPIFLILINILFILFSYCFANFVGLLWNLCVQISDMANWTSLPLISFVLENWLLLCRWHPKEFKLCMSTRAVTRLSLHYRHTTPLWVPWLVAKWNQHFHLQQNKQVSFSRGKKL